MTPNMKTMSILTAAILFATAAAGAASGSVVVDRIVAVVNNEIITMSDLQRERSRGTDIHDEKLVLEEMIDRKIQMAAAKRNGMDVSERELNDAINDIMKRNRLDKTQLEAALAREGLTLEQYRSDLREQMTLSRLFNKYVRSEVTISEAEVRAFYDRNPGQFSRPEEVRVRRLVIRLPEQATTDQVADARARSEGLMARIRSGEDFVRLIRESSDPASAAEDGNLGFLQRGQAIPEIEAAAKNLKTGEYAGPIKTADSFQIIRVEEVRTPLEPYEKIKDDISKMLAEQKMENTYREWLQTLRSESHIENRL
jgi:peptidyl-prolyl cis-trans isomerase SurA